MHGIAKARGAAVLLAFVVAFLGVRTGRARPREGAHGGDGGDEVTKRRFELLEAQSERLQEEVEALSAELARSDRAAAQGPEFEARWGRDVVATWKDGFHLYVLDPEAADPKARPVHGFDLHGRLQLLYQVNADRDNPNADGFRTRRARLQAGGFFFRRLKWVLEVEFATDAKTRLRQAWIDLGWFAPLRLRVGSIKVPYGFEQRVSSKYLNFVERPLWRDIYAIDHDLGAMIHGDLGFASYHVGVFNGAKSQGRDNNDGQDVSAHLVFTPFRVAGTPVLEGLGFGGWFSYGHRRDLALAFKSISGTRWLDFDLPSSGFQRGALARSGAELWLATGPLRLQAEYATLRLEGLSTGRGFKGNLDGEALSFDVLFMLTGETYPVSKRVVPRRNFDPLNGGWGAWQLGFRYEYVDVERAFVRRGAPRGTDRIDAYTIGLNGYLNPYVKLQVNYVHNQFKDRIGVPGAQRTEDVAIVWLGFEF